MKARVALALCALAALACVVPGARAQSGGPTLKPPHGEAAAQVPLGNGRFFWVGSDGNDPFTDEQLEYLVHTASSIIVAQFYAGFDIGASHELARRVKKLDPRVNVFAYMSGTYIKPRFDWAEGKFEDEWILRDLSGEKIVCKFQGKGDDVGAYYADISNPEYRAFLAHVAKDWMNVAPYDGLIFDACNFVTPDLRKTFLDRRPPHPRENTPFSALVTPAKMDALNAGLKDLLRETKNSVGNKLIVWNGFWRKKNAPDRTLALLPIGDIALAERWSISHETDPHAPLYAVLTRSQVIEDVGIVERGLAMGKMFFLKDTFDEDWYAHASPAAVAQLARYGWGMYMLVHTPGRTAYGFSPGPRFAQNFKTDPVLLDPPSFGKALGGVQDLGAVLAREFEHGAVYLNPTDAPVQVKVARPTKLVHGGTGQAGAVSAGATVAVPPHDALIFQGP